MQARLDITDLPAEAGAAARAFYAEWLADAEAVLAKGCAALVIVMPPAPYEHEDWRRAAVRDLARACAPQRVNMVAGAAVGAEDGAAMAATIAYLERAPGVTGQYFTVNEG